MLEKTAIFLLGMLFALSCSNGSEGKPKESTKEEAEAGEVLAVADLAKDLGAHEGKTVQVKGLVTHVCKRSGKKLFLAGSEDGQSFKILASGPISTFDLALEGSQVLVEGKVIRTAPDNKGHNHHDGEKEDDCTTKQIKDYALEGVSVTPVK